MLKNIIVGQILRYQVEADIYLGGAQAMCRLELGPKQLEDFRIRLIEPPHHGRLMDSAARIIRTALDLSLKPAAKR